MTDKAFSPSVQGVAKKILRVAVPPPGPLFTLDYLPPEQTPCPQPGTRVMVRLAGRHRIGLVIGQTSKAYGGRLNRVEGILDEDGPAVPADLLELLLWTARYYHYPLVRVLLHALPKWIRHGRPMDEPQRYAWSVRRPLDSETPARAPDPLQALARAPAQKKLLECLSQGTVNEEDLSAFSPNWRTLIKGLSNKGLVERIALQRTPARPVPSPYKLNRDQDQAVKLILAETDRFVCHLIEGVTGSGKTEIYLRIAEAMLAEGRQTLILVPEIGLTSQLASNFKARFGAGCMVFHSAVSDGQRFRIWCMARKGTINIVIGTRSAVFLPLTRLGAIVVDEEHDLSYKQWEQLRYHARDVSVKRMQLLKRPVVLGSATPSLESMHQAAKRRYKRHHLPKRVGSASELKYEIVDLCQTRLKCGLSPRLIAVLHETVVERRGQALLFINRRGFATRLVCSQCGEITMCPACERPIVYHLSERLARCHHCGRTFSQTHSCKRCQGQIKPLGVGTERIEALLNDLFPGTKVARIDADSTRSKGALERQLDKAGRGEPMLLVGTQMLSKGYHLPHLTLIGIVNLDHRLFSADFRAVERVGQLIEQVSGRAGRGRYEGQVLLQTYHPDSPHINCLLQHGYHRFAKQIMLERKAGLLPPYSFLAMFNAQAKRLNKAMSFLDKVRATLHAAADAEGIAILGPASAMMEKRAGFFRAQLLLRGMRRSALHRCLNQGMERIRAMQTDADLSWSLDIDPMEIENLQEVK